MTTATPAIAVNNNAHKFATLLLRIMPAFWLAAKFIGWKVWLKERIFPVAPVFGWSDWPPIAHYILFASSIALLLLLIVKPLNKPILTALLITEVLSCMADQNRWQPWEYQYLFTILLCIINHSKPQLIVTGIAFMLGATYLYSGLGKLNEGYLVLVWDNIFLKKTFRLGEAWRQNPIVYNGGYITAVLETIFALGLFFRKTQKLSAWFTIFMHLLILYALGPLGMKYNVVVWPWNILMITFLYLIFIKEKVAGIDIKSLLPGWNKLILIAWGLMPALNYLGLWDNYLSCRLYSGSLTQMSFCLKDDFDRQELAPFVSEVDTYNVCNGDAMINLQIWAMREMNVPPYPEMRVYKRMEEIWKKNHPGSSTRIIYYKIIQQTKIELIKNE